MATQPPKEFNSLLSYLKLPIVTPEIATDAIVEYVWGRKKVGKTLFEVSVELIELLQYTDPSLDPAFDSARTILHLPPHTDLTPPSGFFALSRSSSSKAVAMVLSRCPDSISVEHGREVVLEYVLAVEGKVSEKPGGKGGKGTVPGSALEDLGGKMKDIETSLDNPEPEVLSLLLSLRLSLSYLSSTDLESQILLLPLQDAELALRMYVKRRLPGDGRYGVGKALEALEQHVCQQRPALRSVIRTVKGKYLLPTSPKHQIPLPAPSKSKVLSLLQAFANNNSNGTTPAGSSSSASSSAVPPPYPTNSPSSSARPLEDPLGAYALELLMEYGTREKRDYMRAGKWIKVGRVQMGKEVGEMEEKLCLGGKSRSKVSGDSIQNPALLQVFDIIRKVFAIPKGHPEIRLPSGSTHFSPIQLPDEQEMYFPPTLQSVTSALYCNPRLPTQAAVVILLELVEYERDLRVYGSRAMGEDGDERDAMEGRWGMGKKVKMGIVLEGIERRFPDAEYADAFKIVTAKTDCPPSISRAPSYVTIPDKATSDRTSSYLRGNVHRRGSASINSALAVQAPPSPGSSSVPAAAPPIPSPPHVSNRNSQHLDTSPPPIVPPRSPRRPSAVITNGSPLPQAPSTASNGWSALPPPTPQGSSSHSRAASLPGWQPGWLSKSQQGMSNLKLDTNVNGVPEGRSPLSPSRSESQLNTLTPLPISPPGTSSTDGPELELPTESQQQQSRDEGDMRQPVRQDSEDQELSEFYLGYGNLIQPRTPESPGGLLPPMGRSMPSPRRQQTMPTIGTPPARRLDNLPPVPEPVTVTPQQPARPALNALSSTPRPPSPPLVKTPAPATTWKEYSASPSSIPLPPMPTPPAPSTASPATKSSIAKTLSRSKSSASPGSAPALSPTKWRKEFMGGPMGNLLKPANSPGGSPSSSHTGASNNSPSKTPVPPPKR